MGDVFRHLSWKLILQVMILLFSVFLGIETKADPPPAEVELSGKQDPANCPRASSINLELTAIGIGLGGTWGRGTLEFSRKDNDGIVLEETYYFSARGFNLTDVGIARINTFGYVCGLHDISQFSGTYGGVGIDIALAGGVGVSRLWNQHGVVLKLRESLQGIHFGFAGKSLVLTID